MEHGYEAAEPAVDQELEHIGLDIADPDQLAEEEYEEYVAEEAEHDAIQERRKQLLFSTRTLLERKWEPQNFLIGPKLLPKRGKMLISGVTGTGKSVVALNLAASLASGTPMFGIVNLHKDANKGNPTFPIPGTSTVLYVDYEVPHAIRTLDRLEPLVDHFGDKGDQVKDNLFFVQHPTRYRLQNQQGEAPGKGSFDALDELVKATRPDILILDPLSSAHSLQENTNEIKQAYNKADKLIDECACTVIIVVHASPKVQRNQQGQEVERSTIEVVRGHSSQVDWADCHMHLKAVKQERDDQNEKVIEMSFGKLRYCRKPLKRKLVVNFETMEVGPFVE
jgi:RecA-family ATPase